jgi:putative iron-regulated protein
MIAATVAAFGNLMEMDIEEDTMASVRAAFRTAVAAGLGSLLSIMPVSAAPKVSEVVDTYANIALAGYEDALSTAKTLKAKIDAFLAKPSDATLKAAKQAWLAARVPYQQTEVYRFGNKIVDDWEGKVNAWPLDEGLIDYVEGAYKDATSENAYYAANVIANPKLQVGGKEIDATNITKALLADTLHEADKVEANVAIGYHAIEFLLWGQDLNGTGAGVGKRPATDFDKAKCSGGNCERRAAYLKAVTDLLLEELETMVGNWKKDGAARKALKDGGEQEALVAIFTGLGSLSYGELAGERMKLGLLLHDPEEEHDCFSDNTHNSHYYDAVGIRNVYLGSYKRVNGKTVKGASVSDLVKAKSPETDQRVRKALDETVAKMTVLVKRAEGGEAYDQMIGEGNDAGNKAVDGAIGALIGQTKEFERAITSLDLKAIQFEGSDSLDDPSKVLTK